MVKPKKPKAAVWQSPDFNNIAADVERNIPAEQEQPQKSVTLQNAINNDDGAADLQSNTTAIEPTPALQLDELLLDDIFDFDEERLKSPIESGSSVVSRSMLSFMGFYLTERASC